MGKPIDVSVEIFGGKQLRKIYERSELEGISLDEIPKKVLALPWKGEQGRIRSDIEKQMNSSGGYTLQVNTAKENMPVVLEPVRLEDKVINYIRQRDSEPYDEIKIFVLGYRVIC